MAIKRKKVVEIENGKRKVSPKKNEDSKPERSTTVADLTKAFGAQAVGLLVGGLLGGRDGAIAGGQQGAAAGQVLNTVLDAGQAREDKRHDAEFAQDLALDTFSQKGKLAAESNEIKRANTLNDTRALEKKDLKTNVIDPKTGQPLLVDKFGRVTNLRGEAHTGEVRNLDEDKFDQGADRLGVARQNLEERGLSRKLSADRLAFAKYSKDEVSDKQVERFTDIAGGIKASSRIAKLVGGVNTGPVKGRSQALASAFGISTKEFEKLKVASGIQLVSFIKKTSGAAVSEPEAKRLQSLIASVNDTPQQFAAKLAEFQKSLRDEYDTTASSIQKLQGKRVVSLDELLKGTGDQAARDSKAGFNSDQGSIPQGTDLDAAIDSKLTF